jgi:hypothetical protein
MKEKRRKSAKISENIEMKNNGGESANRRRRKNGLSNNGRK